MKRRRFAVGVLAAWGALAAWPGFAAELVSVGAGVGLVDPQGVRNTPWFTANGHWSLGRHVVIEPEVGYWSKKTVVGGTESRVSDLSAGFNILYRRLKGRGGWYAGAGVGAHLVKSSILVESFDPLEDTEIKQGIHLLGGLEYRLGGALDLFLAVRFDGVADLTQNKTYGGVRLRL